MHDEGRTNMSSTLARKKAIEYSLFSMEEDTISWKLMRVRYVSYKAALICLDIMLVCLAFGLSAWSSGYKFDFGENLIQLIILIVFALITLSFFKTFNLYNYHLIFSKKIHLINFGKSVGWSMFVFSLIVSIYMWPRILAHDYFIPVLFLIAMAILLLSRFFSNHMVNIIKIMGLSFFVTGVLGIMNPDEIPEIISNGFVIPAGFVTAVFMLILCRYLLVHLIFNVWMRRKFRRQLAIIGSDQEAITISNHIIEQNAPFWVNGILSRKTRCGIDTIIPKSRLGGLRDLPNIVVQNNIDEIIVTDEELDKHTLISLLDFCTSIGITVWFSPRLMPIIDMKLYIDNFCGLPMIRLCSQKNTWLFNKLKHSMDTLVALPAFILLLPFFISIAIAIKLNSKGPVFYKAKSVGKNGKIFPMFKFRTMRVNNDSGIHKEYVTRLIKGEISSSSDEEQPLKITDDPRITTVGKFLRKFSLDELPQLINVLKGDMSLVGPRPCLPYEYDIYKEWHKKRASVRPGISGLWQVAGRSAVSFEDMILLDIYYIYNRSLDMDFNVLYETLFAVLGKKGAY